MLTTAEKSEEILRTIIGIIRDNSTLNVDDEEIFVKFERDWGPNSGTMTVSMDGQHTHVGFPGSTVEQMIDSLHSTLCESTGLSWAKGQS